MQCTTTTIATIPSSVPKTAIRQYPFPYRLTPQGSPDTLKEKGPQLKLIHILETTTLPLKTQRIEWAQLTDNKQEWGTTDKNEKVAIVDE